MIVRVNGRVLDSDGDPAQARGVKSEPFTWHATRPSVAQAERKAVPVYESLRDRFNRVVKPILKPALPIINMLAVAPVYAAGNTYNVAQVAAAPVTGTGLATALQPVIGMLQELALPVGIGMAIWGLIEVMVGNPGGKDKIKWALISYVGVFIIPFFFYQVRGAFSGIPMAGVF